MKHIVNLSLSQAICYRKVLETWEVGTGVLNYRSILTQKTKWPMGCMATITIYAMLELSIYYRCYLKVSIMLGLHKVRACMWGCSEPCIFRVTEMFLLDQIYLCEHVILCIYLFKAYKLICEYAMMKTMSSV